MLHYALWTIGIAISVLCAIGLWVLNWEFRMSEKMIAADIVLGQWQWLFDYKVLRQERMNVIRREVELQMSNFGGGPTKQTLWWLNLFTFVRRCGKEGIAYPLDLATINKNLCTFVEECDDVELSVEVANTTLDTEVIRAAARGIKVRYASLPAEFQNQHWEALKNL